MTLQRPEPLTTTRSTSGPDLDARWTVAPADASQVPEAIEVDWPIDAVVPGCVHVDLLHHGVIADPFVDANEIDVAWVGEIDWSYVAEFDVSPEARSCERVELVADGLDTLATVTLNGTVIAVTENMHRTHRFDVRDVVREGSNRLEIVFRSSIVEAQRRRDELGYWPSASFDQPYAHIREMAASWGWDWGPSVNMSGVWRPIRLEVGPQVRIADVHAVTHVTRDDRGSIDVRIDLGTEVPDAGVTVDVVLTSRATGDVVSGHFTVGPDRQTESVTVDAGAVQRWWPTGLGAQSLYDLAVTLCRDDQVLDEAHQVLGFRTIELDESADEIGHAFTLVVNGQPIFVRGVNWIPDDPLLTRVDAERYRSRLDDAVDLGVNLIRVWGGGIYESNDFYDACDERGLLVWQDFPFACAAYPQDELFDEVVAEATDNIRRLRSHASLAIWNGNNENTWGHEDWGWKEQLDGKAWGERFYLDTLPGLVARLDHGRAYTDGSPSSGSADAHPNSPDHGTNHDWVVWNDTDHREYRRMIPRFVSEFGWQAPPTLTTISEYLTDDPLTPTSPGMLHHQKALDGNGKLDRGLAPFFDVPDDFDTWHWATQLNQSRAIRTGVEHYRSHRGRCMGTIWWQFNDCWPVTSWAVLDSRGRRKPSWYALRDSYAPRLLTLEPRGSSISLIVVNDSSDPWIEHVQLERVRFDGQVLEHEIIEVEVDPHDSSTIVLADSLATATDGRNELLRARCAGARDALFLHVVDRDLALEPLDVEVDVETVPDLGAQVTIRANRFVYDLAVLADRLGVECDIDLQMVTLLPGESVVRTIDAAVSAEQVRSAIRSANDLVAHGVPPVA